MFFCFDIIKLGDIMENKGFTLSELLVCLAILALVLVIAIPSIIGVVDRNKESQYEMVVNDIISSAEEYVQEHRNEYVSSICQPDCKIQLQDLVNDGKFDRDLINPRTSEKFELVTSYVKVYFDNKEIKYEFVE